MDYFIGPDVGKTGAKAILGAKSKLWRQILPDVFNIDLVTIILMKCIL